ncbi:hypothetical protein ARMSODRAFT_978689 [Armillaria solidipes]|uniref:Uncharacterized protein n=1 Tax=Armillaria solidipes TaxID=1076256 RepID=A0A2H3BD85_9AGAR|nr:hypothetical protein ARMSODRAFT_978689 [Armillaria solidipes]
MSVHTKRRSPSSRLSNRSSKTCPPVPPILERRDLRLVLVRVKGGIKFHYHVPYDLALAAAAVYSNATCSTKKDGRNHWNIAYRQASRIYTPLDLSVFSSLAQYFANMIPLCDAWFNRNLCPQFPPPGTPITDFSADYSAMLTYRASPHNPIRSPYLAIPRRAGRVIRRKGASCVSIRSVRRRAEIFGLLTAKKRARRRIGRDIRRSMRGRCLGTLKITVHVWSLFSHLSGNLSNSYCAQPSVQSNKF